MASFQAAVVQAGSGFERAFKGVFHTGQGYPPRPLWPNCFLHGIEGFTELFLKSYEFLVESAVPRQGIFPLPTLNPSGCRHRLTSNSLCGRSPERDLSLNESSAKVV